MAKVPVRKIVIAGGQTFVDRVAWCEAPYTFKTISAVTLGWPTTITVTAHGVPNGVTVPVWIQNVKGPTALNTTADTPHYAQYADANSLTLVGVNTGGMTAYTANSAVLAYMPPKNITNWIARTQFRTSVTGAVLVDCVSTGVDPEYVISGSLGIATLTLTPAQTRLLIPGNAANNGIAHVELVDPDGVVHRPFDYAWSCTPEGTRET